MKDYKVEICSNSVESAVEAEKGGAWRVELCAGMPEGGTTPSYGEMYIARRAVSIRMHVIIRPRGGDFLYTPVEQEIMLHDIEAARKIGADGVVLGCLTSEGEIDLPLMRRLMEAAGNMSVTFHRAFDMCKDPYRALEDIIALGCQRILTSGQHASAEAGVAVLKRLVEQAAGRIIIMPGCGITATNIQKIAKLTGASEFHFSGRETKESNMVYRNDNVSMGGVVRIAEYEKEVTSAAKVRAAVEALYQ